MSMRLVVPPTRCERCGGPLYDNRATKKGNQPDFKCKKPKGSCDWAMWLPDNAAWAAGTVTVMGQRPPTPMAEIPMPVPGPAPSDGPAPVPLYPVMTEEYIGIVSLYVEGLAKRRRELREQMSALEEKGQEKSAEYADLHWQREQISTLIGQDVQAGVATIWIAYARTRGW